MSIVRLLTTQAFKLLLTIRARSVAWFNTSPCHGEDRQFKSGRARSAKLFFPFFLIIFAVAPRPEYQLELKVQQFGEALLNGNHRTLYQLFVPVFVREIEFSRIDSAVNSWRQGRRPVRIKSQVIETRGLGGYASSYVYFEGENDYEYLYHSWVYTDSGWELAWVSGILNQSFLYGKSETLAMRQVAQSALEFFLSPAGRRHLRLEKIVLPETIVVVQHHRIEEGPMSISGHTVVWQTPLAIRDGPSFPSMPLYCEFGMVRVFGSVALVALDFKSWPYYQGRQVLKKPRGMEIYLKKQDEWQVASVGKLW